MEEERSDEMEVAEEEIEEGEAEEEVEEGEIKISVIFLV